MSDEKLEAGSQKPDGGADIFAKMDRLAEMARGDVPPAMRVNVEMLIKNEAKGPPPPLIFPMAWAAGIAAVAAGLLLVVTLRMTTASNGTVATVNNDPLFSAVKVEMP